MGQTRLTHLLNLYFDGALVDPDKAELERLLLESKHARQFFWEYAALHGLTHEAAKLRWAAARPTGEAKDDRLR